MTVDRNALSSLSATLSDVVDRLGTLARTAGEDDEVGSELLEVERQLTMSHRRLEKAIRRATR